LGCKNFKSAEKEITISLSLKQKHSQRPVNHQVFPLGVTSFLSNTFLQGPPESLNNITTLSGSRAVGKTGLKLGILWVTFLICIQ
jgi:hypothetical protein